MRKTLQVLTVLFISFFQQAYAQCTLVASAINNGPVCDGSTLQLYGNASGGTGPYNFQWDGPNSVASVMQNFTLLNITQAGAGVYRLIVTDINMCVDTAYTTVTITTTPPPTVITPVNYCVGMNATPLTATGTSLLWYTTQVGGTGTSVAPVPNTTVPGIVNYYVSQTVNGCESQRSTISVITTALPVVTATSNSPVCAGDTLELYVNTLMGATYMWTGPNAYTATWQNAIILNAVPLNSGTYTVMASLNGCMSLPSSVNVVVNPTPVILTATSNSPVCEGATLNLSATTSTTAANFNWAGPNTFVAVQQNPSITNVPLAAAGTYTVTVSANGCSSWNQINVVVNQVPSITTTYTDPTTINSSDGNIVISGLITGTSYMVNFTKNGVPQAPMMITASAGTIVITGLSVGTYDNITVTLNGCASNAAGPIVLTATTIVADSVWPGDVNYDLLADNNDILDLALAYGQTGTIRSGASNSWIAQASADWGTLQVNGMDVKHADCDGSGTVDIDDTMTIFLNYGMTHLKGVHIPQAKVTADPDLYFDLTGINLTAGTTVNIPIKLGTTALPMNNIMGIAAHINVDGITLNTAPAINTTTSWLGNNTNTINFDKGVSTSQTDWAYARIDHTNVSGDGTIATMAVEIPVGAVGQDAVFYFDNVKMIDNAGTELTGYNVVDDTATVIPLTIKTGQNNTLQYVAVVPNPSDAQATLQLSLVQDVNLQIYVTDVTGRNVWNHTADIRAGMHSIALPADKIPAGIYSIRINDSKGILTQTLKWIKK